MRGVVAAAAVLGLALAACSSDDGPRLGEHMKWCDDAHTVQCPEWELCEVDSPPPVGPCCIPNAGMNCP